MLRHARRGRAGLAAVLALLALLAPPLLACEPELTPVAPATWVVEGAREEIAADNCGLIANLGVIATGEGVVLIDSGPSRTLGEALEAEIMALTGQPVRWVLNTHHHPDHVFGNQAFANAEVLALAGTAEAMARDAAAFEANLRRLLGEAFAGTRLRLPDRAVAPGRHDFGGYPLELYAFRGHSGADLVIFDAATGVLFAGDLVFHQRTATTPHTPGLQAWIEELDRLEALRYRVMVPGHGPVDHEGAALAQTRDYLAWLDRHFDEQASRGATANQVREAPLPERFASLALAEYELTRSLSHLYPRYEQRWLWGEAP